MIPKTYIFFNGPDCIPIIHHCDTPDSLVAVIADKYWVETKDGEVFLLTPDWAQTDKNELDAELMTMFNPEFFLTDLTMECEDSALEKKAFDQIKVAGIVFKVEEFYHRKAVSA